MQVSKFTNESTGCSAAVVRTPKGYDVIATDDDAGEVFYSRHGFASQDSAETHARNIMVGA